MVDYQVQIYTNTMNYQNILYIILSSGGPVVASSNLVIPTAENERLTQEEWVFFDLFNNENYLIYLVTSSIR